MKEKKFTFDIETGGLNSHGYYGRNNHFIDGSWYEAIAESERQGISFDDIRPRKTAIVTKTPKETNRMLLLC